MPGVWSQREGRPRLRADGTSSLPPSASLPAPVSLPPTPLPPTPRPPGAAAALTFRRWCLNNGVDMNTFKSSPKDELPGAREGEGGRAGQVRPSLTETRVGCLSYASRPGTRLCRSASQRDTPND